MKRMVSYGDTPQVTALEYNELFDMKEHPEKREHYEHLAKVRTSFDRNNKEDRG